MSFVTSSAQMQYIFMPELETIGTVIRSNLAFFQNEISYPDTLSTLVD